MLSHEADALPLSTPLVTFSGYLETQRLFLIWYRLKLEWGMGVLRTKNFKLPFEEEEIDLRTIH